MKPQNKKRCNIAATLICSILLTIAAFAAGLVFFKGIAIAPVLFCIVVGLLLLLCISSAVCAPLYTKRFLSMSEKEKENFILSYRDDVQKDIDYEAKKLKRTITVIKIYEVFIFILYVATAFLAGAAGVNTSSSTILVPLWGIMCMLFKLFESNVKFDFSEYTEEKDLPYLYALAKKAMDTNGVKGKIRIVILPDCNAGIQKFKDTYSVQVGVYMLCVLSEDELYQVFLHEFAHMAYDYKSLFDKVNKLLSFLSNNELFISRFLSASALPEVILSLKTELFSTVAAIHNERYADNAIKKHGNPQAAINGLAKIGMYYFFDAEPNDYAVRFWSRDEMTKTPCSDYCAEFKKALLERKDFWSELYEKEIPARISSHPTFKQRKEAFGCESFSVELPDDNASEYRKECNKAIEMCNEKWYNANAQTFAEQKKECYTEPLETVEKYESSDKQYPVDELRHVIDAYSALCRYDKAEQVCDYIISLGEPEEVDSYAFYVKGSLLLSRYDSRGIDYMYNAIKGNHNAIEPALDEIGEFCTKMGLQKELDEYRKKSIELVQQDRDEFSKTSYINKNDNLCADDMPKEMLSEIINVMLDKGGDEIDQIYLVRKIVSDTFYASIFIIRFESDECDKTREILDKIFNYLDARPEHFSLFTYEKNYVKILKKIKGSLVYDKVSKNNSEN